VSDFDAASDRQASESTPLGSPPGAPPRGSGAAARLLALVEWLGNLLPHPVTLFALFALVVVLISGLAAGLDFQVEDPRPVGTKGRSEDGVIRAVSLLSGEGFRRIIDNLVANFVGFAPLGTVLVALLGVGVAERSGLLSSVIRLVVLAAPPWLVTVALVMAGVLSNTASEMGYVVIVPMGAAIFHGLGRHPLAGLAAAFAGVSGGYSANLLIGTVDPLLAGITQEAARLIDVQYTVHPAVNWYFMIVSTFLITAVGSWVTLVVVEPRLGPYTLTPAGGEPTGVTDQQLRPLEDREWQGLLAASAVAAALLLGLIWLSGPAWLHGLLGSWPGFGVLRNPQTGGLLDSSLLRGVVAFIFVGFLVPGFVYGRWVGTIRNDRELIEAMADAMRSMGLYIVLVFFAAQFVKYFEWTNLGSILAVLGADWLRWLQLDNAAVFVPFILMCCFVNLMLGSASAQWAVTAPIFVPMLMLVGYSPEIIQAAYRIGDSSTNVITPMMSYFGIIYACASRYDSKLGMGTLISTMLPYSVAFAVSWMLLFYVWVFGLGLPVGPGSPTYYLPPQVGL
jgi:aminobenzoyl-glutamate transport protein